MSRRVNSRRPKKLSSDAPMTPSRPRPLSLATDHQLVRMKSICRRAEGADRRPVAMRALQRGVGLPEQEAREDALTGMLHARDELARAHLDERRLLDGTIDLRGDAVEALAFGGDVRLLGRLVGGRRRAELADLRAQLLEWPAKVFARILGVVLDLLDAGAQRGEIALAAAAARGSSLRPRWRSAVRLPA